MVIGQSAVVRNFFLLFCGHPDGAQVIVSYHRWSVTVWCCCVVHPATETSTTCITAQDQLASDGTRTESDDDDDDNEEDDDTEEDDEGESTSDTDADSSESPSFNMVRPSFFVNASIYNVILVLKT